MANRLTQKVQHSEVKVIFFNLSVADFEVMEKRDNQILQFLLVIEVQMIGVSVDEGDDSA